MLVFPFVIRQNWHFIGWKEWCSYMTYSQVFERHKENELFTFVIPSGDEGNQVLVMTDIKIYRDDVYPVFRDITYAQPCYFMFEDLKHIFGEALLKFYNLWTIDDIESLVEHQD